MPLILLGTGGLYLGLVLVVVLLVLVLLLDLEDAGTEGGVRVVLEVAVLEEEEGGLMAIVGGTTMVVLTARLEDALEEDLESRGGVLLGEFLLLLIVAYV